MPIAIAGMINVDMSFRSGKNRLGRERGTSAISFTNLMSALKKRFNRIARPEDSTRAKIKENLDKRVFPSP
jgi:hypothetical protein